MGSTRREFMKSAGGAAAALSLSSALPLDLAGQTAGAGAKKRYAIIGTGVAASACGAAT